MIKVLILDPVSAVLGHELTQAGVEVVDLCDATSEERDAAYPEADSVVVRSRTQVDRALMDQAPGLRLIGRAGAGTDNIDVELAKERGIQVISVPGGNEIAVAELVLGLMLSLARKIVPAVDASREGKWAKSRLMGIELHGETLGVIGLGRIGSRLAHMALALGMRVIGFDPYIDASRFSDSQIEFRSFDETLAESRFISVHVPLAESTRGLIGSNEIARMRKDAYLIQCSRGGIIREDDLAQALEDGRLAGAALDVFENEPKIPERLARNPKLLATPHIGGSTVQAQEKIASVLGREMARAFGLS